MNHTVGRRALAKGAAWAVPTVVATTLIPAYAASPSEACKQAIDSSFEAATLNLAAQYYCNGSPAALELNLYQPYGMENGGGTTLSINVKNISGCNLTFSADYPLRLLVEVRNNNVVNNAGRSIMEPSTSSGKINTVRNTNMNNQPVGTVNHTVNWSFSGTINNNQEKDLNIGFGDGYVGGTTYWNNYVTITPLVSSGAPTFEATGASDTEECRAYYNQKLTTWVSPITWYTRGPLSNPLTQPLASGSAADSRTFGNYSSSLLAHSRDGIW